MTPAEKLEHARRIAAELGLSLDGLDRLAVSPRTAARLLSVSHSQVEKLVARGELAGFHVGRSVRIEVVELVAFMERNRKRRSALRTRSLRARAIELIERAE
jgi:excisionase family DNA binding protein